MGARSAADDGAGTVSPTPARAADAAMSRRTALAGGALFVAVLVVSGVLAKSPRDQGVSAEVSTRAVPLLEQELGTLQLLFAADRASAERRADLLRRRLQNDVDQYLAGVVPFPNGGGGDAPPAGRMIGGIATGRVVADLAGDVAAEVTVAVLLTRSAAWSARLSLRQPGGDTTETRVLGADDRGHLQFAPVLLSGGSRPERIGFDGPPAEPFVWNVLLRP